MTEVNGSAEEFRLRNAEYVIGRGLEAVRAAQGSSLGLWRRFADEAELWRSNLSDQVIGDRSIARAWATLDRPTISLLDLLFERDEDEWRAWLRFARRVTHDVAEVLGSEAAIQSAISLPGPDRATIEILSIAATYDLELPSTPAHWRSLSGIHAATGERMVAMDDLVAESIAQIESSALGLLTVQPERNAMAHASGAAGSARRVEHQRKYGHLKTEVLLDQFSDLTLHELSEFVKAFEEKFEVTAAAPVAVAGAGGAGAAEEVEEKDSFDVILEAAGDKKIQVIKVVRELTSLGLGEAKAVVDGAPKAVLEGVKGDAATKARAALEAAGATVNLK